MTKLSVNAENWPLAQPFRFAGHNVTALEVVHVQLTRGEAQGQGEGVVPIVFNRTMAEALAQLQGVVRAVSKGQSLETACADLPPGPARNALDCALWDLAAKSSDNSIWTLADLPSGPARLEVDQSIGLGAPEEMAEVARTSQHRVLKIKADASLVIERLRAIRLARPDAELIVDANQSWTTEILARQGKLLADLGVAMIEQPLPVGQDGALRGLGCPVPLYADESCHTRADLPGLIGAYQGINIKLDKTGGLTEALALAHAARAAGMGVMVGCMAGTSLSMAPAFVIGTLANWSDLDGPLLLAHDRPAAMIYDQGTLSHFTPALWG